VPSPNLKQNTGQTVNHAADLKVMHTATDPVDQPCDDANGNMKCPWPKQLFLQEDVVITGTKSSSFNMKQHPFDVQVMAWARARARASPNPEPRTPNPEPLTPNP